MGALRRWSLVALSLCACALVTDLSDLSDGGHDSSVDGAAADVAADASGDALEDTARTDGCVPLGIVQSTYTSQFTPQTTTVVTALPDPVTQGDYVVVGLNYEGACGYVSSVTDTFGNGYQRLGQFDSLSAALVLEAWGVANVSSGDGGIDTLTATFDSTCYLRDIKAVELRGVDRTLVPPVPIASSKGTGGAPEASITTAGSALLFAHTGDQNGAVGPGAGWLPIFIDGWQTLAEYEIVPSAGAYPIAYVPSDSGAWAIQAVALPACQ